MCACTHFIKIFARKLLCHHGYTMLYNALCIHILQFITVYKIARYHNILPGARMII